MVKFSDHLPVLDGVRVLATIWIIIFHLGWYLGVPAVTTEPQYRELFFNRRHFLTGVVTSGTASVDVLFVLTGFLLAKPFLTSALAAKEKAAPADKTTTITTTASTTATTQPSEQPYTTPTFFQYFIPRVSRLYPIMVLLSVFVWARRPTPAGTPQNPNYSLFEQFSQCFGASNYVMWGGPLGWTWSLSIQLQFMVFFFLLLKFCKNAKMLAKLSFALGLFAATIVRAYLYFAHFHGVEQEYPIYIYSDKEVWYFDLIFRTWYASSLNRSPGLFFGVVLCYCYYYQDEYPIFKKIHDALGNAGRNVATFVTLWLFLFTTQSPTYGLSPNPFYSLFMTISSPYQMFTICTFLWCVLNSYCTIFSHFLSTTIFQKLAYSSYGVYQIHLPVILTLARGAYYPPYEKLMDTMEFYKYAAKVFAISTTLGYILTRFVEEPLRVRINNLVRPQREKKVD